MTAITTAARLLRVAADELKNTHTLGGDWGNEHEALDAYNEHMATVTTLEHMARQCLQQIEEPAGAAPAAAPTPMAWPVAREELLDWARFADTAKGYSDLPNIRYSMGTLAMVLTNLASKAPMAAPAAPWKDHQTARLVNDLRDCAIKYHGAGQLRERIAHIVVPLCDQLKGALAAPAAPAVDALSQAARDVLAERQRQISAEGYEPEADQMYEAGELARAAATYALLATGDDGWRVEDNWPWGMSTLKRAEPRRMLEKAGALILADMERLDRAAAQAAAKGAAS